MSGRNLPAPGAIQKDAPDSGCPAHDCVESRAGRGRGPVSGQFNRRVGLPRCRQGYHPASTCRWADVGLLDKCERPSWTGDLRDPLGCLIAEDVATGSLIGLGDGLSGLARAIAEFYQDGLDLGFIRGLNSSVRLYRIWLDRSPCTLKGCIPSDRWHPIELEGVRSRDKGGRTGSAIIAPIRGSTQRAGWLTS